MLTPEITRIEPGAKAPDYTGETFTGDSVSLSSYRGQVLLLNIWATWCAPCEAEMPSMERLYRELGPEGLKIVAVSIDQTSSDAVQKWVNEHGLTFTVLHDASGRIQQTYQTTGVPESFLIDRSGAIVKKVWATDWDHPTQVALIRRLLAAQ